VIVERLIESVIDDSLAKPAHARRPFGPLWSGGANEIEFEPAGQVGDLDDIRAMIREGCASFESEGGRLIKSLIGEVQRNPGLAAALRRQVIDDRREKARRIIEAAVERGEIPTVRRDRPSMRRTPRRPEGGGR
jgi:hypothetical protein